MKTTTLGKENLARIDKLAGSFVDDVNIVVAKLLDYWDQRTAPSSHPPLPQGRLSDRDRFTFVGDPVTHLAPQAKAIVSIVRNFGKGGITRLDLIEEMKRTMPARQAHFKILTFYQKKLVEEKWLKLQKA